jgi:orotate phosphoribosyltransferase
MSLVSATAGQNTDAKTDDLALAFVKFSVESGVLRFGEFKTKAGRLSPYFFNSGLFDDGAKLGRLGEFYARRLLASGVAFDMLFGPAYKGITLAAATAVELARLGHNTPYAHNRKEAKQHGEGGLMVGAPLQGRVVIIDDVITDGASKRESVDMIRAASAQPVAVLIALDRMERAGNPPNVSNGAEGQLSEHSAVENFTRAYGMPVVTIATVVDLLQYLKSSGDPDLRAHVAAVTAYRDRYGV